MNADKPFLSWEEAVTWLQEQPDKEQLVRDCYYDNPLQDSVLRYWHSDEWAAVRERLSNRSGKALDIGAGRGIASYALARDGFAVTALEPDSSNLVGAGAIRKLAADTDLPIQVVEDFSESLPFADNEFDIVFARAALHHSANLESACQEFSRVLKPGGLLVAIREHVITRQEDLPRFLDSHPLHNFYGGENAYLLDRYKSAISQSGLNLTELISPWYSPINFASGNLDSLKADLARRAGFNIGVIRYFWRILLDIPGAWKIIRFMLTKIDNRPGRLYSFVAEKG